MTWQTQVATWTANNRYPGIFRTVRARIAQTRGPDLGQGRLKVLSFGCSNGAELSSLRAYFPDAQLYGCDVNPHALREAAEALREQEAAVFESSPEAIAAHGPFDAVLAMSVLCRFPESAAPGMLDLRSVYSPDSFARAVDVLAGSLRPGGVMVLYNTNYPFAALPAARRFRALTSPLVPGNGFVDKFDLSGRRLTRYEHRGPHVVHRPDPARPDGEVDFLRCIYELLPDGEGGGGGADAAVATGGETAAPDGPPDGHAFGPDLDACAREGVVAAALGFWRREGGARLVRAWRRTTLDGALAQGPAWAVDWDPAAPSPLVTDPARFAPAPAPAPAWNVRALAGRLRARVAGA